MPDADSNQATSFCVSSLMETCRRAVRHLYIQIVFISEEGKAHDLIGEFINEASFKICMDWCRIRYGVLSPAAGDLPEFQRRMNKLSLTKVLSLSVFSVGCQGVGDINGKMAMRGQAADSATDRKTVRSCYGSHDCGRPSRHLYVVQWRSVFGHFCGMINQTR